MTVRDQDANNLGDVLDLQNPDFTTPPKLEIPPGEFRPPCFADIIMDKADAAGRSLEVIWDSSINKLESSISLDGFWTEILSSSPFIIAPTNSAEFFRVIKRQ